MHSSYTSSPHGHDNSDNTRRGHRDSSVYQYSDNLNLRAPGSGGLSSQVRGLHLGSSPHSNVPQHPNHPPYGREESLTPEQSNRKGSLPYRRNDLLPSHSGSDQANRRGSLASSRDAYDTPPPSQYIDPRTHYSNHLRGLVYSSNDDFTPFPTQSTAPLPTNTQLSTLSKRAHPERDDS
ncbi:uncharacterized protein MELLADRAFT_64573 [Melampsora larici-populina 98AG31]|uniref:Uncharacterized protein n=1 Tax=Melampsora larici-populina (strain 98AG31 / pathotype 3-4-7) TaxID=747676 RepID=F4RRY4_MELLP|nr:uncharacterized protein MELLADRAFT_64573 [Melampsora larici-populina 98AG31]EGG04759.1 hypothetical protein MELLADRAFT_64573 [Melampsora larici-populina 98AG31]